MSVFVLKRTCTLSSLLAEQFAEQFGEMFTYVFVYFLGGEGGGARAV